MIVSSGIPCLSYSSVLVEPKEVMKDLINCLCGRFYMLVWVGLISAQGDGLQASFKGCKVVP